MMKNEKKLFYKIKQLDNKPDNFSKAYEIFKQNLNLSLEQVFATVATDNQVPSKSRSTNKSWFDDTLLELNRIQTCFYFNASSTLSNTPIKKFTHG